MPQFPNLQVATVLDKTGIDLSTLPIAYQLTQISYGWALYQDSTRYIIMLGHLRSGQNGVSRNSLEERAKEVGMEKKINVLFIHIDRYL